MSDGILKPCMVCGWRRKESYADAPGGDRRYWALVCESCGAHDPSFSEYSNGAKEAIAAWNTRAEASSAEPVADLAGYERGQRETVERIVAFIREQRDNADKRLAECTHDKSALNFAAASVSCQRLADAIEAEEWK